MTYNVTEDIYYKNFISSKTNITNQSKLNYQRTLNKFTKATNTSLTTIIDTCKKQQDRVIEKIINHGEDENGNQIIEKQIIKFDVNGPDSKIKQYLDQFIQSCKDQGNSNTTINQNLTLIKKLRIKMKK